MRESCWRSLARPILVASLLLAGGACAPKLDLSNRPPPCGDGYSLCPATGACAADVADRSKALMDPANPGTLLPTDCPSALSVRQGGTLSLAAPGATLDDVTAEGVRDLTATPVASAGGVSIEIAAPHGAVVDNQDVQHFVTITTTIGGYSFVRHVLVLTSFITAAPGGDDSNEGTVPSPFSTLAHAAAVASAGDTIQVLGSAKDQDSTLWPAWARAATRDGSSRASGSNIPGGGTAPVSIPNGVTVQGTPVQFGDGMPIPILMRLDLAGDAKLGFLVLSQRLVVRQAGSHVTLVDDTLGSGLTIDASASPAVPGGKGASVELTRTAVTLPEQPLSKPTDGPLVVAADGASVTLGDSSPVTMPLVASPAPLDSIRIDGHGVSLSITAGSARINNSDGGDALHVTGSANVAVTGERFINRVEFDPSTTSTATFDSATFDGAPLTFHGQLLRLSSNTTFSDSPLTFDGQTLQMFDTIITNQKVLLDLAAGSPNVQADVEIDNSTFTNADVTFAGRDLWIHSTTTFSNSLLTFHGHSLIVADTIFSGQGIVHDSVGSVSMLQNVQITNYKQFGYRLLMGRVNVMGGLFNHDPSLTPAPDGTSGPWALRVEAAGDTESGVTSHATKYDGMDAPPIECTSTPAVSYAGVLSVVDDTVPISLCD